MCNERLARAARPVSLVLLVSYPVAVHLGVLSGVMWPALAVLAALFLLPPLLSSPSVGRLFLVSLALLILVALFQLAPDTLQRLVYAPPLLITLLLLLLFARSLLPGREALVSRIARLLHENPSQTLLRYTRAVTVAWVVFLGLMLVEVVALGLFATAETWSLFTNFLNYLLMGLFFVLEFSLRRLFIAADERMPMMRFFHKLIRLDYRKLLWQR